VIRQVMGVLVVAIGIRYLWSGRELAHPWQYAVLGGAMALLLPLRRGVVLTLLSAAAIGVTIALMVGTVSP
jgi:hypothetical protein